MSNAPCASIRARGQLLCGALALGMLACAAASSASPSQHDAAEAAEVDGPPVVVAKPPTEPPEVVRWGELAKELAGLLGAAGPDCAAVAQAMDRFVASRGAELTRTQKALLAWEREAAGGDIAVFYRRYFPAVEVRIDAAMRCAADKRTVEAYDRFFGVMGLDQR